MVRPAAGEKGDCCVSQETSRNFGDADVTATAKVRFSRAGGSNSGGHEARAPFAKRDDVHETGCTAQEEDRAEALAATVSEAFADSVRNNVLAEFGAQAIRFAGIIFLARILSPADFGVLKALLSVTFIALIFVQGGISDALIQRRELTREHECAGWWVNLAVTIATIVVVYLGAGKIADLMEMPALKPGIRLMCVPIFIEGTSMIGSADLERALRFGVLALADVLAEVGFLLGAIVLLFMGLPQWSLIGGLAARFAVHGLTIWTVNPRAYVSFPRPGAVRDLLRFAFSVWGGRIAWSTSANADYLLIGRLLGSDALGLYGMARDLLRFVPNRLHKVAGRVTYSAFCKLQDHDREMARAYAQFYNSIARIILPMMACIVVTAPDLVRTMYGQHWVGVVAPLQVLALGLTFAGLKTAVSSIYFAKGYPSFDIHLNGLRLLLVVAVIFALRHTGLLGIAAGISAVEVAISITAQYVGGLFTHLTLGDMLHESAPGIRLAALCGTASFLASCVSHHFGISGTPGLAIALLPAAAIYFRLEGSNVMEMTKQAFSSRRASSEAREEGSGAEAGAL